MKKGKLNLIIIFLFISILGASCSASRGTGGTSKKCGCGLNKGFVGY
jgi:hypothetical protein